MAYGGAGKNRSGWCTATVPTKGIFSDADDIVLANTTSSICGGVRACEHVTSKFLESFSYSRVDSVDDLRPPSLAFLHNQNRAAPRASTADGATLRTLACVSSVLNVLHPLAHAHKVSTCLSRAIPAAIVHRRARSAPAYPSSRRTKT